MEPSPKPDGNKNTEVDCSVDERLRRTESMLENMLHRMERVQQPPALPYSTEHAPYARAKYGQPHLVHHMGQPQVLSSPPPQYTCPQYYQSFGSQAAFPQYVHQSTRQPGQEAMAMSTAQSTHDNFPSATFHATAVDLQEPQHPPYASPQHLNPLVSPQHLNTHASPQVLNMGPLSPPPPPPSYQTLSMDDMMASMSAMTPVQRAEFLNRFK